MSIPKDFCPFMGIEPFTETDRDYFFGRGREQRIIISNLYAAPLTVLYGASGVGKTSVLLAGAVPILRKSPRTAVIIFREWQDDAFSELLKTECIAAVEAAQQEKLDIDTTLPLDEFLFAACEKFQGTLLIIFDQFEEYFLYHTDSETRTSFEAEFARAVNREEIDANFLLSLREDGLAKLDRFKSRIPALMSNLLPLQRMDTKAAEEAIREPLKVYNTRLDSREKTITIQDGLVKTILNQVLTVHTGDQIKKAEKQNRVEAPFLQLVMTCLWAKEIQAGSRALRLNTLKQLGGAKTIVRTHLASQMEKLKPGEKNLCARIFDRLVTPSGSKIAIKDQDLKNYAGDLAGMLPGVLKKLSAYDSRILRSLRIPGESGGQRYEIYHDVLASAILEWQDEFLNAQKEAARRKKLLLRLSTVASIVIIAMIFFGFKCYYTWKEVRPWGLLNNLSTGSVHLLRDATVSVGRDANALGFNNTVKLAPSFISRIHLLLNEDLKAIDMRSLNGTTINHAFLPYGQTVKLEDNDLIVLADIAPFQFQKISYSPYQFWNSRVPPAKHPPSGAWGIFLDLNAKKTDYLTNPKYFISEADHDGLSLTTKQTDKWICYIKFDRGYPLILDRQDNITLSGAIKTGSTYAYRGGSIPSEYEFFYFVWKDLNWPHLVSHHNLDERERKEHGVQQVLFYTSTGRYFRILPIRTDLEPK